MWSGSRASGSFENPSSTCRASQSASVKSAICQQPKAKPGGHSGLYRPSAYSSMAEGKAYWVSLDEKRSTAGGASASSPDPRSASSSIASFTVSAASVTSPTPPTTAKDRSTTTATAPATMPVIAHGDIGRRGRSLPGATTGADAATGSWASSTPRAVASVDAHSSACARPASSGYRDGCRVHASSA